MLGQRGLLICCLRCYRTHAGLLCCCPDRTSVRCIGLVVLNERADEPRVQQYDFMTQDRNLACPPVRASARFQGNAACYPLAEKFYKLLLRDPLMLSDKKLEEQLSALRGISDTLL